MKFGNETRDATKDANDGIVYPPTKKMKEANTGAVVVNRRKDRNIYEEQVAQNVGSALGSAFESFMDENLENAKKKAVVNASARQGQDTAINDVDKMHRRTGWEKALAGQDVRYRQAQQQAVSNKIRNEAMIEMNQVRDRAHLDPEQYIQGLQDKVDEMVKPYANDPETALMLTMEWGKQANRLAEMQYKEHYGFTQTQMQNELYKTYQQEWDMLKLEQERAHSPEEKHRLQVKMDAMFRHDIKFTAGIQTNPNIPLTQQSVRNAFVTSINNEIEAGNTIAMQAANERGWVDGLTPKELPHFLKAQSAYDAKRNQEYSERVAIYQQDHEHLLQRIDRAKSPKEELEVFEASYHSYWKAWNELEAMGQYKSGSQQGDTNLEAQKARLRAMHGSIFEKASEAAQKAAKHKSAIEVYGSFDAQDLAEKRSNYLQLGGSVNDKDYKAAMDTGFKAALYNASPEIKAFFGDTAFEDIPNSKFVEFIFNNPTNPALVAELNRINKIHGDNPPPMVGEILDAVVYAFNSDQNDVRMVGEDGLVTRKGMDMFQLMSVLSENNTLVKDRLSTDEILVMQDMLDAYKMNSGDNQISPRKVWQLNQAGESSTKFSDVHGKGSSASKAFATNFADFNQAEKNAYYPVWERALKIHNNDISKAKKAVLQYKQSDFIKGGQNVVIDGALQLNNLFTADNMPDANVWANKHSTQLGNLQKVTREDLKSTIQGAYPKSIGDFMGALQDHPELIIDEIRALNGMTVEVDSAGNKTNKPNGIWNVIRSGELNAVGGMTLTSNTGERVTFTKDRIKAISAMIQEKRLETILEDGYYNYIQRLKNLQSEADIREKYALGEPDE